MEEKNEGVKANAQVKAIIEEYCPGFLELTTEDFPWSRVTTLINKELQTRITNLLAQGGVNDENSSIMVQAGFLDLLIEEAKGSELASKKNKVFQFLFEELSDRLSKEEKKRIQGILANILKSMDHKSFNWIGELLVLNHLLKAGYKFHTIETSLETVGSNGKADLLMIEPNEQKPYLIEIINIHPDREKILAEDFDAKKFIEGKIIQKHEKKGVKFKSINFHVVCVIWADYLSIRTIAEKLASTPLEVGFLEPVYLGSFIKEDGSPEFHFGILSDLVSKFDKRVIKE